MISNEDRKTLAETLDILKGLETEHTAHKKHSPNQPLRMIELDTHEAAVLWRFIRGAAGLNALRQAMAGEWPPERDPEAARRAVPVYRGEDLPPITPAEALATIMRTADIQTRPDGTVLATAGTQTTEDSK